MSKPFLQSVDWDCALGLSVNIFRQVSDTLNCPDNTDRVTLIPEKSPLRGVSEEVARENWIQKKWITPPRFTCICYAQVLRLARDNGRVAGFLPATADTLYAPSQSTCPWFLSVSQSRASTANKILQPVHLNGLRLLTGKQRRHVWRLTKHRNTSHRQACIFCERANKSEPPI